MDINKFLKKYTENKYTEQEHQEFIDWLNGQSVNTVKKVLKNYYDVIKNDTKISDDIKGALTEEKREELLSRIEQVIVGTNRKEMQLRSYGFLKRVAAVAAILIVVISVFSHFHEDHNIRKEKTKKHQKEITSLILKDGAVLNLDSIREGEEIVQGAVKIQRSEDGQLIYNIIDKSGENLKNDYNTINTAIGKQSFVKLADGTKVWLNAASSLRFPVNFTKEERVVELEGEAYFEVAKEKRTFKIITNRQNVEVLGTHFNVNAYEDNQYVKTTLLEGSVRLNSAKSNQSVILRPGEQGIGSKNELFVREIDAQEVIGWKKGLFIFTNEPIHSVMKEISRWYNVEIVYEGQITEEGFVMNISRSENINDVLRKLEFTGLVHFKLMPGHVSGKEGRVIVMP
ncbi:FecR family protein [Pseudopedobacter beijingensis]|uniref:FecR family protein n=1 Tax=Pseudopedobacter beijingensis TaxID=1207056 RepID=A0ABW4IEF9_9SPHI